MLLLGLTVFLSALGLAILIAQTGTRHRAGRLLSTTGFFLVTFGLLWVTAALVPLPMGWMAAAVGVFILTDNAGDRRMATALSRRHGTNVPVYVIHPTGGITKWDPATPEKPSQQVAETFWKKGPKKRCKEPCEDIEVPQ